MSFSKGLCAAEATSIHPDTLVAIAEVLDCLVPKIGAQPDAAVLFFTPHHKEYAQEIQQEIYARLGPDSLLGSTCVSVVGGGHEEQGGPGISLWAANMPGTKVQAFHVAFEEEAGVVSGWPDVGARASAIFIADPFSFPLEPFFASLRSHARFPSLVGGLASGAHRPGGNLLMCDQDIFVNGAVGLVMKGAARIEPLVSQGCRPLGPEFEVTSSHRNQVLELNGHDAYEGLHKTLQELDDADRQRFMAGPQVGIQAVKNRTGEKGQSFLIRGVVGVNAEKGSIALAEMVRDGAVLQFHTRDRQTAHEDMDGLVAMASSFHPDAAGALTFLCTGRGLGLFQTPDHDIGVLKKYFPNMPVSGMFAAGEIGPVCGLPYVHGQTACVGLLVPSEPSSTEDS